MTIYIQFIELSKYQYPVLYNVEKAFHVSSTDSAQDPALKKYRPLAFLCIQAIQKFHQLLTTPARRIIIEQIQLCDALTEEVP
ncbi:hypothetical protein CIP106467_2805 [Citrobacter europaeus]|nr:hypothetical protein CIP106467_2805 [Citrobacter europaeus]